MTGWRVPPGLGTAGGMAVGLLCDLPLCRTGWWILGGGAATLLLGTARLHPSLSRAIVLPAVLLLGAATASLRQNAPPPLPRSEDVVVLGKITHWENNSNWVSLRVEAHRVGETRFYPVPVIHVLGDTAWGTVPRSAWVELRGRLEPDRGVTTPGAWDDPGVDGRFYPARDQDPVWGPGGPPGLTRWRARLADRARVLGGFPARLAEAVLLGRPRALTPEERDTFRRTGTSHLVAVSGLHVGLVAALAGLALARCPWPVRGASMAASAWLYAGVAGWSPSAIRAAALVTGYGLGRSVHRNRPTAHWLALALPWLLWAQPGLIQSLSFRLSLGAVGGILFALELAPTGSKRWAWILGPALVSLGAQWGTLPAIVSGFGALSPLATIPNLIAVPLAGLFLPATLLSLLAPPLFADAARILGAGIGGGLHELAVYLPFWTGLGLPPVWVPPLHALLPWLWFTAPRSVRRRGVVRGMGGVAAVLLAGLCFLHPRFPPGPWVAFLDVGQGDAAVLRLSDETVWVFDVGDDRGPGDAARNVILPFLRKRGIRRVDGLVLSHRHRDHVGALPTLLAGIAVEAVYDAGYGGNGGTSGRVDSLLTRHRLWPCLVAAGDTLHGGEETALIAIHPPRGDPLGSPPGGNLNDASLMVLAIDRSLRILFAGDAEEHGEAICLRGDPLIGADVLKVGHHGSDTSTTREFLRAVRPKWAVISCGEGNRYGHPAPQTVTRLQRSGVFVVRTDLDGSALFVWDEAGRVYLERHPPRRVSRHPLPPTP